MGNSGMKVFNVLPRHLDDAASMFRFAGELRRISYRFATVPEVTRRFKAQLASGICNRGLCGNTALNGSVSDAV